MKKLVHELERDGYVTRWTMGPRATREVYVDILKDGKLVLEWAFALVAGNSLIGNAAVYLEQAILYAKSPPGRKIIHGVSSEAVCGTAGEG